MTLDFFAERLKSSRKAKHLTQLDLAHRLGISKGAVSAYEQNLSYPSLETLVKICQILDTSADYLLGLTDELSFKMGGLSTEQADSVLQFIAVIQKANSIVNRRSI